MKMRKLVVYTENVTMPWLTGQLRFLDTETGNLYRVQAGEVGDDEVVATGYVPCDREGGTWKNQGSVTVDPAILPTDPVPGYARLSEVLAAAYDQAARGKGKERHANNKPFHEQRMQEISKLQGNPYGMAFQVQKKLLEGLEMKCPDARKRELLGAIVYLAGIVVYLDQEGE